MLSDDTIRKIQALMDKADEIMQRFPGMNRTEAVLCANANMTERQILELQARAAKIEEQQNEQIQVEYRVAATRKTMYESLKK